jgi:hypothetical protein
MNQALHSQGIALNTHANDGPQSHWCNEGMMAKGLTCMDVGDVDFNDWQPSALDGVV